MSFHFTLVDPLKIHLHIDPLPPLDSFAQSLNFSSSMMSRLKLNQETFINSSPDLLSISDTVRVFYLGDTFGVCQAVQMTHSDSMSPDRPLWLPSISSPLPLSSIHPLLSSVGCFSDHPMVSKPPPQRNKTSLGNKLLLPTNIFKRNHDLLSRKSTSSYSRFSILSTLDPWSPLLYPSLHLETFARCNFN